jgi:glycopeptide antibiotics resistance protein
MSTTNKNSLVLLSLFVLFIFYGTTLPYDLTSEGRVIRHNIDSIRWTPMTRPDGSRESIPDMVSNVLLFIPLGALIGWVISQRRKRVSWRLIFGLALFGSALLSGLVETLQLLSVSRITSVTDLLTNTFGGLLGAVLVALFLKLLPGSHLQWTDREHLPAPELLLVLAYAAVLFLSATVPFDVSLDIGHIKTGLRAVRLDPLSDPTPWSKMLGSALWMAGLSFLLGLTLFRRKLRGQSSGGRLLAGLAALAGAALLTVALEFMQIFIGSRVAAVRDILAGLAGAVYGVLWFLLLRPSVPVSKEPSAQGKTRSFRSSRLFWPVAIHYLIFLVHGALYPYAFARPGNLSDLIAQALVPFASYYGKTNALALFDFLGGILRFIPLGFLLQGSGLDGGHHLQASGFPANVSRVR